MTKTPPDWAFNRAQELRNKRGFTHLDAFAAYIAEHEQPPSGELVGKLHWRLPEGITLELRQVSRREFIDARPITGLPTLFAVWPEPETST
jgi:hypothetical protein